ncbi:MAG: PH domain-containing protein [Actinomycetota bacterium]
MKHRASHSRYIGDSESIVLEVRRHYAVLLRPCLETVGVAVAASALGSLLSPLRGDDIIDTVLGLVTILFVLRLLWKGLQWLEDRVVVTDQRMFEVSGILTRKVASMPLAKLTDLTYRRSVLGRVFGYGDLVVETPGQRQALTHIDFLPRPDEFYRQLTQLVMFRNPDAGPQPDADVLDVDDEDTGPLPRVIV